MKKVYSCNFGFIALAHAFCAMPNPVFFSPQFHLCANDCHLPSVYSAKESQFVGICLTSLKIGRRERREQCCLLCKFSFKDQAEYKTSEQVHKPRSVDPGHLAC